VKQSFTMRVEEVDLKEWLRASRGVGMTISEWARRGLNAYASGDGKNLRGIRRDDLARGSARPPGPPSSVPAPSAEADDMLGAGAAERFRNQYIRPGVESEHAAAPAKPKDPEEGADGNRSHAESSPAELLPSSHRLDRPEHEKDCQCGVCDFARKAGLKPPLPPKRDKKEDKKPGKKARR